MQGSCVVIRGILVFQCGVRGDREVWEKWFWSSGIACWKVSGRTTASELVCALELVAWPGSEE